MVDIRVKRIETKVRRPGPGGPKLGNRIDGLLVPRANSIIGSPD